MFMMLKMQSNHPTTSRSRILPQHLHPSPSQPSSASTKSHDWTPTTMPAKLQSKSTPAPYTPIPIPSPTAYG